ncbi:spore germination protein [Neobacillus endophyticus]|uniref:spore germination protein n=1 Tax=Neobacillus endophyticus TaxID=2738405 RepID=UPI001FEA4AD4|nr:spore germination protein [Neobacillus endophyticus]
MVTSQNGINISTISGGIVNFGGAIVIAPISVTKTINGSGGGNTGLDVNTNSLRGGETQGTNAELAQVANMLRRLTADPVVKKKNNEENIPMMNAGSKKRGSAMNRIKGRG